MNKEEHHIALIEKYIFHKITDKEIEEFDLLISGDRSFQNLYKEMAVLIPGIGSSARKLLLNDLKGMEEKLPEINSQSFIQPKRNIRWITWSSAAAACIIGLVFTISLLKSGDNRFSEVYNQYYKPYNSLVIAGNRSGDITNPLKTEAFERYTAGDYVSAIKQLESLNKTMKDSEIQFYLASAYMATGQLSMAEFNFKQILQKETLFNDQVKWYLSLCYLKTNKIEKAREIFKELTNYPNIYSKNAKDLLLLIK